MILTVTLKMAGGEFSVSTDVDAASLGVSDDQFCLEFLHPAVAVILPQARRKRRIPDPEPELVQGAKS